MKNKDIQSKIDVILDIDNLEKLNTLIKIIWGIHLTKVPPTYSISGMEDYPTNYNML